MSRILIDLTEFKDWGGHLTGVQRVVYNIASQIANVQEKNLVEYVNFDEMQNELVSDDLRNYNSNTKSSAHPIGVKTRESSSKGIARSIYFRTPYGVRRRITPEQKKLLKILAKKTYGGAKRLKSAAVRKSAVQASKIVPRDHLNINPGDTLIIAGRLWDHPAYIDYLIEKKREIDFKLVIVVFDLIPIYQQHTFGQGLTEPFAKYLFHILSIADVLLPISKSTAKDLQRFAEETGFINIPKIQVIRLGDDIEMTADLIRPEWLSEDIKDYTICVGTIEARKNHILIYQAYKLAVERNIKLPPILIIGKQGWLTGDVIHFFQNDIELKSSVIIRSGVSDSELNWLYKNALYSLYPSQYEGWGLPVAESLMYGVPCITSNVSSMPEIAPDLVQLISPFNAAELLDNMVKLSTPKINNKKRTEIASNYESTSWLQTAHQIIDIIK